MRNNREYDSISKEIEFQTLDIQLSEKRIKEFKVAKDTKSEVLEQAKEVFNERKKDLTHKKKELKEIVAETEKEEEALNKKSKTAAGKIEERLLSAYKRIRSNSRNGLGVVTVERESCGGCFNKMFVNREQRKQEWQYAKRGPVQVDRVVEIEKINGHRDQQDDPQDRWNDQRQVGCIDLQGSPQAEIIQIVQHGNHLILLRRKESHDWAAQYRFDLQPHTYPDYDDMCRFHQTSPDSHFTKARICSRATEDGRLTLSDMRYIVTSLSQPTRSERTLSSNEEYDRLLQDDFGIVMK